MSYATMQDVSFALVTDCELRDGSWQHLEPESPSPRMARRTALILAIHDGHDHKFCIAAATCESVDRITVLTASLLGLSRRAEAAIAAVYHDAGRRNIHGRWLDSGSTCGKDENGEGSYQNAHGCLHHSSGSAASRHVPQLRQSLLVHVPASHASHTSFDHHRPAHVTVALWPRCRTRIVSAAGFPISVASLLSEAP